MSRRPVTDRPQTPAERMRRSRERRRAAGIPSPEAARRLVVEALAGYPRAAREKLLDLVCRRAPEDQRPGVRAMVRELLQLAPAPADPRQYDLVKAAADAVRADAGAALQRLAEEKQGLQADERRYAERLAAAERAVAEAQRICDTADGHPADVAPRSALLTARHNLDSLQQAACARRDRLDAIAQDEAAWRQRMADLQAR